MELQPVELNHAGQGMGGRGENGPSWVGEGDVGEVHRLLTSAFFLLLCCSVRVVLGGVHFERSSFAFLGSFLLDVTDGGKEGGGAEHSVAVSAW